MRGPGRRALAGAALLLLLGLLLLRRGARPEAGTSQAAGSVPRCHQSERLAAVQHFCVRHKHNVTVPAQPQRLKEFVKHLYVDDRHNALVCLHAKAGSGTWKLILANNSREEPLRKSFNVHNDSLLESVGHVRRLSTYSPDDIRARLRTYRKVMVVRHPLDRLQSVYEEKFLKLKVWPVTKGRKILRTYHPELPEEEILAGKVTFQDLVQWVLDGHQDEHWSAPYHAQCHPCQLRYDHVIKLETQASDATALVHNVLGGRGAATARNRNRGRSEHDGLTLEGRRLGGTGRSASASGSGSGPGTRTTWRCSGMSSSGAS